MKFFFITLACLLGNAMQYVYSQNVIEIIESYMPNSELTYDEAVLEKLTELSNNPLNLNTITQKDCATFTFLTEFEQLSVWDYISKNRPLASIFELQLVLGLPLSKAQLLSQFTCVKNEPIIPTVYDLLHRGTHTMSYSYSTIPVDENSYMKNYGFVNGPTKRVLRYRYAAYNSLFWGFTGKTDMGEKASLQNNAGFDYTSAYIQLKRKNIYAIIGDYQLSIGQGFTISQSGFWGKTLEQISSKHHTILSKHSSSNEFEFCRGIATEIDFRGFTITPFVSLKTLDGKIQNDTLFPFQIYNTGLHRTKSEIENKQSIKHNLAGIHIQKKIGYWQYGFASAFHSFSKDSTQTTIANNSFMYHYHKKKLHVFGESSIDKRGNIAAVQGLRTYITNDVELITMYRFYTKEYSSFMASAYSKQTELHNEQGWSSQLQMTLSKSMSAHCIFDVYTIDQKSITLIPNQNRDVRLKLQYANYSNTIMYYQFAMSSKYENENSSLFGTYKNTTHKTFHKLYMSVQIQEQLQSKSGILVQNISENDVAKNGLLLYEDIVIHITKKFALSARYAYFNAPYEARLYAWEDNVLYGYSSSQYFYKGTAWYGIVKWKLTDNCDFQAKISHTTYDDSIILPDTYEMYDSNRKISYTGILLIHW